MEKLVSSWVGIDSVPESYILPPDLRPVKADVAGSVAIPVIDFASDHREIVNQVLQAGKEFGIFQVVNHGIPNQVLADMLDVAKEFFEMSIEDKEPYYWEAMGKPVSLCTGVSYRKEATLYWRDSLKLTCNSIEEHIHLWPEKPTKFREIAARCAVEKRGLSTKLLNVICEGLGLEKEYLAGDFTGDRVLQVNHYPKCPDPSLTLGLPKHIDGNLMTLLLQDISGLEALYDGEWIEVEPLPNAIVVNYGHQLEFISNGVLRAVEHRAVNKSETSRTTIATFINPKFECVICPAPQIVDKHSPQLYRPFLYKEFLRLFLASGGNREAIMEAFTVKNE